jgi:heme-degrading monooxygenase HmoA
MPPTQASCCIQAKIKIMIHQLRIYEIFETNKSAFHTRFRDHAARIMKTYGFQIAAMWEARSGEKTQFIYLLEWPDEAAKTAAWSAFMADAEWGEIKRVTSAKHGSLVGGIEDRILVPLDYSPAAGRSLLPPAA